MGAAVTAMERRGIKTEVGNMNREIRKINALILSSMENIERLTDKITFLEKEKKAVGQEEKETPAEEKKPDTLISILMEWQQNRSAFIQGNNIRQRTDTKAGNVKDFSVMVAFLQSHKIETLEDLRKLAEDTKKRRSDNIHNQRELNAKLKKMSNIVDIYQAYKPYAEYLKKYESLSGRQKQSYYGKNADKIEFDDDGCAMLGHWHPEAINLLPPRFPISERDQLRIENIRRFLSAKDSNPASPV